MRGAVSVCLCSILKNSLYLLAMPLHNVPRHISRCKETAPAIKLCTAADSVGVSHARARCPHRLTRCCQACRRHRLLGAAAGMEDPGWCWLQLPSPFWKMTVDTELSTWMGKRQRSRGVHRMGPGCLPAKQKRLARNGPTGGGSANFLFLSRLLMGVLMSANPQRRGEQNHK